MGVIEGFATFALENEVEESEYDYQIKFMINDRKYTYTALLPDYFKKLLKIKRLKLPNS